MNVNVKFFKEIGVKAMVYYFEKKGKNGAAFLSNDNNIITIPRRGIPTRFELVVIASNPNLVIVQKDISTKNGSYHRKFSHGSSNGIFGKESASIQIEVLRIGKNVWTPWHQENPNRLDCYILENNGDIKLYQIGIVTHDNGKTFRLLCELRWEGRLYRNGDGKNIVGKPSNSVWGSFENRRKILDFPGFKTRLQQINLSKWKGSKEELDTPLDQIPLGKARVDWYIPFAGQTGQGIVKLDNGSSIWIHGSDLLIEPDPDGIRRVHRNDLLTYQKIVPFGKAFRLLRAEKI